MTQVLFWEAIRRSLLPEHELLTAKVRLVITVMTAAEDDASVRIRVMHPATARLPGMSMDELRRADPPLVTQINEVEWLGYELLSVLGRRHHEVRDRIVQAYRNEYERLFPQPPEQPGDEQPAPEQPADVPVDAIVAEADQSMGHGLEQSATPSRTTKRMRRAEDT